MSQPDTPVNFIRYRFDGREKTTTGRPAWALAQLIAAGPDGVTPITHVGPRWSEYIRRNRNDGLDIETVNEMHGGAFKGRHGRYVLRSQVEVIEMKTAIAGNAEAE